MANKINFTRAAIEALTPAPEGKRDYYNDSRIPGLQLQVTANGTKTFYVYRRINGRPKRVKLGRYPDMPPAQAREEAKITIGQIAAGEDPAERKRLERAETAILKDVFDEFLKVRTLTPKTRYDYVNVMNHAFKDWQGKQLQRITKDMAGKRHQQLGKKSGEAYANLAMRVFRSVYNFAAARYEDADGNSLLPPNPVQRISATRTWFKQKRRDNYITEAALPAWFRAVLDHKANAQSVTAATVADLLPVLILTGLRSSEATTLTWSDIDLDNRTLTVRDTKNHEDHTLPLSDYLFQLLSERKAKAETQWVFPSERSDTHLVEPRKQIARIIQASGVTFTIHDLRRTFSTYAMRLVPEAARKHLMNHKSGDVTFQHYSPKDVELLRQPMQAITDFLLNAGQVRSASIIHLSKRAK